MDGLATAQRQTAVNRHQLKYDKDKQNEMEYRTFCIVRLMKMKCFVIKEQCVMQAFAVNEACISIFNKRFLSLSASSHFISSFRAYCSYTVWISVPEISSKRCFCKMFSCPVFFLLLLLPTSHASTKWKSFM